MGQQATCWLRNANSGLPRTTDVTRSAGSGLFCDGGARPPVQAMIAFIDDHRGAHGVEPICKVLPIAPSTYHAHVGQAAGSRQAVGARQAGYRAEDQRVFDQNFRVYGVRKVWRQLKREGFDGARCTVSRLMRDMSLGSSAANPSRPRSATRLRHARWITSTASSRRQGRTSFGSPTSPMS